MINHLFVSPDRNNKIGPGSPLPRKKQVEVASSPYLQVNGNPEQRKEGGNGPLSPHLHYYAQKLQGGRSDETMQREGLEQTVRELSERVGRIALKLGNHEAVLLKITENSLENNKEEYKRGLGSGREQQKYSDATVENLQKLRQEFEQYRAGTIFAKEMEVKAQLFSELIHKSEERMREEIQEALRLRAPEVSEEKLQQLDRVVRKTEKNLALNTSTIYEAMEKIEGLSASLEGQVDLINSELNKAMSKIVSFVNEKVSKPLNESLLDILSRLEKIERTPSANPFGVFRVSHLKSEKLRSAAEYEQRLVVNGRQIMIREKVYHIDMDGYLLDEEFHYLLDKQQQRIRLQEQQIAKLRAEKMMS